MTVEKKINNDIPVMCSPATEFPAGIIEAFKRLESASPEFCSRTFYGLSRGKSDGGIEYLAAVEERHNGEAANHGLRRQVISAGDYASITVLNFRTDTAAIGEAFRTLLRHPRLDRLTWCVEVYNDSDVECMVRLRD